MKQDFEYNEEQFENASDDVNPISIDEMLKQDTDEDKCKMPSIKIKKKAIYIFLGVTAAVILLSIVAYFLYSYLHNKVDDNTKVHESMDTIKFDENGFLISGDNTIEQTTLFKYELDDIKKLRDAGYTNTEIDSFELEERMDIETLVIEQKERTRQNLLDIYRGFLRDSKDNGNDAYLYAQANTWIGLAPQIINQDVEVKDFYKDSANADYWKLPLQGFQPMLKVRFIDEQDKERTVYVTIDPSLYVELKDSGNIVITYDFISAYDCEFIVNVKVME